MKRVISTALLPLFILSFCCSCVSCRTSCRTTDAEHPFTRYLIVGLDDAAENTDVLILATYDPGRGGLSFLQIPRDTYFRAGGVTHKINGLYPTLRISGMDSREAMSRLTETLAGTLGVPVFGYLAATLSSFSGIVDLLGGVTVRMPYPLSFIGTDGREVSLVKGENAIDGRAACELARYRAGYVTGDLGRLEAQKFLLQALFHRLRDGVSARDFLRLSEYLAKQTVSDIPFADTVRLFLTLRPRLADVAVCYATMPGTPLIHGTASYYVLNRPATSALLADYAGATASFDPGFSFFPTESAELREAYTQQTVRYRIYSDFALGKS